MQSKECEKCESRRHTMIAMIVVATVSSLIWGAVFSEQWRQEGYDKAMQEIKAQQEPCCQGVDK